MENSEPIYYLDLNVHANRDRIKCAKPSKPVKVLVRLDVDRTAPPIEARGLLLENLQDFIVSVDTTVGTVTHTRGWVELNADIASHEKYD